MNKILSQEIESQKGFTLVELIVVIAILGILGAIAIPNLTGFRESAAEKADRATAAVIGNAARLYQMDNYDETEITLTKLKDENLLERDDLKPQKQKEIGFVISINNGSIIVEYEGKQGQEEGKLYPAP